jgi:hypothetical protein
MEVDGSTANSKLTNCATQPCTVFALVDTILPRTEFFKIKSSFPGGMTHLSPTVAVQVVCGNAYSITEVASPTNP